METDKQDPDGSKDAAKRRVGSALQTGTIFHHVVKNFQHSASQRFTVNVKDCITTCCGPKALREGEHKAAPTACVKTGEMRSLYYTPSFPHLFLVLYFSRPLPLAFISNRPGKSGETGNQYTGWNDDFMRNTQLSSSANKTVGSLIPNPAAKP